MTLRVKDAVCDVFREACGARPDVDTRAPDVRIHAFLSATRLHALPRHVGRAAVQARLPQGRRRGAAAGEPRRGNPAGSRGWDARDAAPRSDVRQRHVPVRSRDDRARPRAGPRSRVRFREARRCSTRARGRRSADAARAPRAHRRTRCRSTAATATATRSSSRARISRRSGIENLVTLKQADVLEMPPPAPSGRHRHQPALRRAPAGPAVARRALSEARRCAEEEIRRAGPPTSSPRTCACRS